MSLQADIVSFVSSVRFIHYFGVTGSTLSRWFSFTFLNSPTFGLLSVLCSCDIWFISELTGTDLDTAS